MRANNDIVARIAVGNVLSIDVVVQMQERGTLLVLAKLTRLITFPCKAANVAVVGCVLCTESMNLNFSHLRHNMGIECVEGH